MNKAQINSQKVCETLARALEKQLLHLRDCAHGLVIKSQAIIPDDSDIENLTPNGDFITAYRALSATFSTHISEIGASSGFADLALGLNSSLSKAYLCRAIWEKSKMLEHPLMLDDLLPKEPYLPDMRVAYVKNSYADVAYRSFSKVLPGSSVIYPRNFEEACEDVYDNRSGFCILPYATSDEGALPSFRRMVRKYELVQIMSCTVQTHPDGGKTTTYALFAKGFRQALLPEKSPKFLKIVIDRPTGAILSNIYSSAELNGLTHICSESIPLAWDSERYSCTITFSIGDADAAPFLLYLTLEVPESSTECIYAEI